LHIIWNDLAAFKRDEFGQFLDLQSVALTPRALLFGGVSSKTGRCMNASRPNAMMDSGVMVQTTEEAEAIGVPGKYAASVLELLHATKHIPKTGLVHPLMLARFLVFAPDVATAAAMVHAAAVWREEVNMSALLQEWGNISRSGGNSEATSAPPWWCNPHSERAKLTDRHFCMGRATTVLAHGSRPVVVVRLGCFDFKGVVREGLEGLMMNQFVSTLEDVLWAGHALSVARKELVFGVVVADLDGVSLSMLQYVGMMREMARIANNYFPDLVDRMVLINAPRAFASAWNAMSTLFVPSTREKIKILGCNFADSFEGASSIRLESLPSFMGGQSNESTLPACQPVPMGAGRGLDLRFGGRPELF